MSQFSLDALKQKLADVPAEEKFRRRLTNYGGTLSMYMTLDFATQLFPERPALHLLLSGLLNPTETCRDNIRPYIHNSP